jgi:hypothetical protein
MYGVIYLLKWMSIATNVVTGCGYDQDEARDTVLKAHENTKVNNSLLLFSYCYIAL